MFPSLNRYVFAADNRSGRWSAFDRSIRWIGINNNSKGFSNFLISFINLRIFYDSELQVLFSGFLLYHTQHIVHKAEAHPYYAAVPYDPVNASISIYMDTINIFVRIATILAGGGNRKR